MKETSEKSLSWKSCLKVMSANTDNMTFLAIPVVGTVELAARCALLLLTILLPKLSLLRLLQSEPHVLHQYLLLLIDLWLGVLYAVCHFLILRKLLL